MKIQSDKEKVFYAIALLLNQGEKHITRYGIAKVSGVDYSHVRRILLKHTKE